MDARTRSRHLTLTIIFVVSLAVTLTGQTPGGKRPVGYDAYDGWRSIQGTKIARDGSWLVYALVPQDGDGELVARNLKTGGEFRHPRGKDPVFSADGRFVVFTIAPPKAEVDKAKKAKKKPEDQPKGGLGIMNLANGQVATAERVKNFKVPEEGGTFIAYLLEPPVKKAEAKPAEEKKETEVKPEDEKEGKKKEKKKEPGTDLIIRDLPTGTQSVVGEVTEYSWTKDGTLLAYAVSSKTPAIDGALVRKAGEAASRPLLTGQGNYKGLAFDEKGMRLGFVSDRDDYKSEASPYKLFLWNTGNEGAGEIVPAGGGLSTGSAVSENGKLEFSKDGKMLFFGTAAAPKAEPKDAPDPIKVDIWNYRDADLQPMQKVRLEDEKKRSYRAVYHLKEKRFVQLASKDMPSITTVDAGVRALGVSDVPYRPLVSWDTDYSDYYLVNLQDGSRRKMIEKQHYGASLSPGGGFILYFDDADGAWHAIRTEDGKATNLTGKLGVSFREEEWDTPDQPRPYGSAGWTEGDKTVLLYDRYDIWEAQPDGSAAPRMITGGAGRSKGIVFRYQKLDPEEKAISPSRAMLLHATDDKTKATGYFRAAGEANAQPVPLVMLDKAVGNLLKPKNAETLVFTLSRFEEFPDLWVSDGNFSGMKKISGANPQQADYVWGRSELIEYRNVDGKALRAILTKPENFNPAKKYPLIVYIYEKLTNGLHRYIPPAPGTSICIPRYVSNGYIVLQPDIVYQTGYPGESALKCVLPAVQRVVDMGFVDTERIGIQGHSWGGYQISYMITRTNVFRAVEAGASVVNMISAYGGIRWGTGMSRAFQYEKSQSRIGAPPWQRPLQFIENSPLFWVEKVNTPYLTIANDEDDAVPWYQGIEFFTALRHLGKEAYMFNYNGEKHGLRERENQKHWTVHLDEFFDHHLLGRPAPEWMEKGVPYMERGKRDVDPLYEKAATPK
jgi:dipeptidyl aminopeptidase/acylaminoacyl peptidase